MGRKQLILVRHAKAFEKEEFEGVDFERPLTIHGEHSIFIMARYLRLIGIKPDQIFASPSIRTKETAEVIAKKYMVECIDWHADLYNGFRKEKDDSDKIHLKAIRSAKIETNTLMVVGHNDDLTQFVTYLTGEWMPNMKKGSVVVLSVPDKLAWSDVTAGSLEVVYYLTPQFLLLENLVS